MPRTELQERQEQKKKQRGLNLKVIRNLVASIKPELKSQEAFALACDVGVSTLRQWEAGLLYGLSEEGADIVIHFAKRHSVICTKSWLLENIGDSPRIDKQNQTSDNLVTGKNRFLAQILESLDAEHSIEKEIEIFTQINENAVVQRVKDDSMLPLYLSGDYVGGQFLIKENITLALNKDCIIKLENEQTIIRHLTKGNREGLYKAYCINIQATAKHDPLFNIPIKAAAPIKRVWRK